MITRLLFLFVLAACVIAPSADAAAKRTCRSGTTVYKHDGVRVFEDGRAGDDEWFACGPRTRRPTSLYGATGGYGGLGVIGRSGDKVLFEGSASGEGGGDYTYVGWFDARTSLARSGELAGTFSNEVLDAVVAADGSVGVLVAIEDLDDVEIDADDGVRVGYLARVRGRRDLRGELALSTVGGRYARGSLAFGDAGRTLGWRLDGGQARSVPVAGETVTCTSGTTLVESDGVRVFEVLPRRRTDRGFQADVLAACARGATTPRELAVSDVHDQDHWNIRSLKRAGSRSVFLAGDTGVGLIDAVAGDVRFTQPKAAAYLQDVAVGSAGPPVFAGHGYTGDFGDQRVVARLTGETGDWERLGVQGGDFAETSLAVGEDARVTWQTKDGVTRSAPLDGETAIDCAAGTTLLEQDGLRVFEVRPFGAGDARLLACPPGATVPVQLLSARRNSSWRVSEVTREDGHYVISSFEVTASRDEYRFIGFGASAGSARAGVPNAGVGTTRDAAFAPDGRMAFALSQGDKWTITAFALAGPGALKRERVLARPKDGFRAGTLAFSADGTRVVWRSRSGAARGARVSG